MGLFCILTVVVGYTTLYIYQKLELYAQNSDYYHMYTKNKCKTMVLHKIICHSMNFRSKQLETTPVMITKTWVM